MPPWVEDIIRGTVDLVAGAFDQNTLSVFEAVGKLDLGIRQDAVVQFGGVQAYRTGNLFDSAGGQDTLCNEQGLEGPAESRAVVMEFRVLLLDVIIPIKSRFARGAGSGKIFGA